jgi:hypothetical protein
VSDAEVVMMPNGFAGSWLVTGPSDAAGSTIRTGMSEVESERVGRAWAKKIGVPFRRVTSWRYA